MVLSLIEGLENKYFVSLACDKSGYMEKKVALFFEFFFKCDYIMREFC